MKLSLCFNNSLFFPKLKEICFTHVELLEYFYEYNCMNIKPYYN